MHVRCTPAALVLRAYTGRVGWLSPRRILLFAVAVLAVGLVGVALARRPASTATEVTRCDGSVIRRAGPERAFAVLRDKPDALLRTAWGTVCAVRALHNRFGTVYVWIETGAQRLGGRIALPARVRVCTDWRSPRGGGGGGCGEASTTDKRGSISTSALLVALPRKYSYTVTGIVPDGVRTVRVFNRNGTSKTVRVVHNAIIVGVNGLPRYPRRAYEYRLPDGRLETGKSE